MYIGGHPEVVHAYGMTQSRFVELDDAVSVAERFFRDARLHVETEQCRELFSIFRDNVALQRLISVPGQTEVSLFQDTSSDIIQSSGSYSLDTGTEAVATLDRRGYVMAAEIPGRIMIYPDLLTPQVRLKAYLGGSRNSAGICVEDDIAHEVRHLDLQNRLYPTFQFMWALDEAHACATHSGASPQGDRYLEHHPHETTDLIWGTNLFYALQEMGKDEGLFVDWLSEQDLDTDSGSPKHEWEIKRLIHDHLRLDANELAQLAQDRKLRLYTESVFFRYQIHTLFRKTTQIKIG